MGTETLAVATVMASISRTRHLEPFFNTHDREPVWDGYIAVFSSGASQRKNEDLLLRVPVQIKGENNETDGPEIQYPVRTSDLRKFRLEHPTVFFVVRTKEKERETIYYHVFRSEEVGSVLSDKGRQNTVSFTFNRFPEEVEKVEKIFFSIVGSSNSSVTNGVETVPATLQELLSFDSGFVEFWGRSAEYDALEDFLACAGDFRWWGIAAPDGAGKSRLALEFKEDLEAHGPWTAHFLSEEDYENLTMVPDRYKGPLLLIADDAFYHIEELGRWMTTLSSGWIRDEPLRLLLLDRDEGWRAGTYGWERQLFAAGNESLLYGSRYDELMSLSPLEDDALISLIQDFAFKLCLDGHRRGL